MAIDGQGIGEYESTPPSTCDDNAKHAKRVAKAKQRLLRPDLWDLLLPAIKSARQAGQGYMRDGRYVPRQEVTEYDENEAGWPRMTKQVLGMGPKNGPVDWLELFGFSENPLTHIHVAKVPELATALREISGSALKDDALMRGVSILAPLMTAPEKRRKQIEFETIRSFIGAILNRADALGAESDDELESIYVEIEKARFAEELTGDVVVPLVAVSFDADSPVRVDKNTWIERMSETEQRVRAMPWIQHGNVSPYVAAAATHAVVMRNVRFPNRVHSWNPEIEILREPADHVARTVAEAIHIVTEMVTGYAQILVRPHGWADSWMHDLPPLWSAWEGRAYPEILNNRHWEEKMNPINAKEIDEIVRITKALKTAPKNVQIASRRCRRTTFRDDAEDAILDAAIGIEALVGKEQDALTHRMAQRAAIALGESFPPENTYSLLKQFYKVRSKIAHGETPKQWMVSLGENRWDAVSTGMFLLRMLLRSHLLADDPWDAATLDQRMLKTFERSEGYPSGESPEA